MKARYIKRMNGHPRFYELIQEEEIIHSVKNQDYAREEDPLSNLRASEAIGIPGWAGNFVRMMDKWERCKNLIGRKLEDGKGNPAVKSESLKDTLLDLAIYCKLEIILLEEDERK